MEAHLPGPTVRQGLAEPPAEGLPLRGAGPEASVRAVKGGGLDQSARTSQQAQLILNEDLKGGAEVTPAFSRPFQRAWIPQMKCGEWQHAVIREGGGRL